MWMGGLMAPPYIMSRAIDDGLRAGDRGALVWWCVAFVVLAALLAFVGILRHRTMTFVRTDAALRTVQIVVRHVSGLGAVVRRRLSAGELTYLQNGDTARIAHALTSTGPGVGAVVAYFGTAVLLFGVSPLVAVVVLLGVPALALVTGPVMKRLHAVEGDFRASQGAVTARAGDIVAGLRVLSGVGGKPAFEARYRELSGAVLGDGYRAARYASWVLAVGLGLPTVFVGVVTWLIARMALNGEMSPGDVVAVYGYVSMLIVPVLFFMEGADSIPRALVSARRVIDVLSLQPDVDDGGTGAAPEVPADLVDPVSGLVVRAGVVTALAGANAGEVRVLVDRLGRLVESEVTWGGVPLRSLPLAEVRRRIVVADNEDYLFHGVVRESLSVGRHDDVDFEQAVWTAAAVDVLEALPDGAATVLESQGRNVSGGQRQRLRLVRALLAEPDVLILVEPTSALDAATEATVASRVREARHGRTTVVVSSSPLLLAQADFVAHVDGDEVVVGTHGQLLAERPGYRALALREDVDLEETR